MNYYVLIYETVDDYAARRPAFREQHLRAAREARNRGELVLAGAFADPIDRALLVFCVDDKSKVEDFAGKDPYVVNGLVKRWEVRPWTVVVGNEKPAASVAGRSAEVMRHWSARTTKAQLPQYLDHFSKNVLPELRAVSGYLGATLYLRRIDNEVEILVATSWRSLESIRNFTGPDLENAVVADEAAAFLTEFDRRVRHYEIAISDSPQDARSTHAGR